MKALPQETERLTAALAASITEPTPARMVKFWIPDPETGQPTQPEDVFFLAEDLAAKASELLMVISAGPNAEAALRIADAENIYAVEPAIAQRLADLLKQGQSVVETPAGEAKSIRRLKLADVELDEALMMRVHLDEDAIEDYADKYRRERAAKESGDSDTAPFPLPVVFEILEEGDVASDAKRLVLAHGWHRFTAMESAGLEEWEFEVRVGTLAEAATFAAEANRENATVRYTNSDKRNAVLKLLAIPALRKRSDRQLGEIAGVDGKTVAKYRPAEDRELPKLGKDEKVRNPPRPSPATALTAEPPQLPPEPESSSVGEPSAELPQSPESERRPLSKTEAETRRVLSRGTELRFVESTFAFSHKGELVEVEVINIDGPGVTGIVRLL